MTMLLKHREGDGVRNDPYIRMVVTKMRGIELPGGVAGYLAEIHQTQGIKVALRALIDYSMGSEDGVLVAGIYFRAVAMEGTRTVEEFAVKLDELNAEIQRVLRGC